MAKPLVFQKAGQTVSFEMTKVDRSKLYGYKELETLDEDGEKCELASLAEDGHTIIGKGGTGMGYLSADGNWCDKSQLRPVDLNGEVMTPVDSSFSASIELNESTTVDDYLGHTIRATYLMETTDGHPLLDEIRQGSIFKFPYSFRGGIEFDTAFLLANDAGEIFMAVGSPAKIQFVGLQQASGIVTEDTDNEPILDEDLDFGMI